MQMQLQESHSDFTKKLLKYDCFMCFRKMIIAYMHLFSLLSIYPLHAFVIKVGVQAAFATLLFIYLF